MKKLLLFVFMMCILIPVHGLEDSNMIRKYKYYRLNEVLGPMVTKEEITEDFPLIYEDNYTEGELSDLSIDRPLEKDGRKIYEYDGFHYVKPMKVNSIEIKANEGYRFSDIKLESVQGDISYESNNNDIVTYENSRIFKLEKESDLSDLIINCIGTGDTEKYLFSIIFKKDDFVVGDIYINTFLDNIVLCGRDVPVKKNAYENVYSLKKLDDDSLTYKGTIKLYQYQDYKFQSYKLEREYYDEYLSEPFEDYIYRDETDYIDVLKNDLTKDETTGGLEKVSSLIAEKPTVEKTSAIVKNEDKDDVPKNNISIPVNDYSNFKLPIQYDNALKADNKTASNNVNSKPIYYYFILVILTILLLLTLKLKNKLKECYRW